MIDLIQSSASPDNTVLHQCIETASLNASVVTSLVKSLSHFPRGNRSTHFYDTQIIEAPQMLREIVKTASAISSYNGLQYVDLTPNDIPSTFQGARDFITSLNTLIIHKVAHFLPQDTELKTKFSVNDRESNGTQFLMELHWGEGPENDWNEIAKLYNELEKVFDRIARDSFISQRATFELLGGSCIQSSIQIAHT